MNLSDSICAAMTLTEELHVLSLCGNNTSEMQAKVAELSAVLDRQAAIHAETVTPELA